MVSNVATQLGDLVENVVFLGGAATALLITDSAANDVRPTMDVDVIVELTTTAEYHRFAEQLRERGFREDTSEEAPLYRWLTGRMIVDIMPTDEASLGFGNRWYRAAYKQAMTMEIDRLHIRVVTGPYFLATKLDAFHGRGNGDFMASHDMEDIIALIDGRSELVDEIAQGPEGLRIHLGETFRELLRNKRFLEALPGHLAGDTASQQRLPILEARMNRIAEVV
jgi:hypothetical protein